MVIGASPNAFVVPAQSDIKTMPELIAKAKANPGKLNWTSPGAGTTPYLAGEVLKLRTGIDMLHIPFPGAGPATTAVLAGQVDLYTANIGSLMALIDAGKVRPIAVTSRERWPDLPNVPSLEELGVKGRRLRYLPGHLRAGRDAAAGHRPPGEGTRSDPQPPRYSGEVRESGPSRCRRRTGGFPRAHRARGSDVQGHHRQGGIEDTIAKGRACLMAQQRNAPSHTR